MYKENSILLWWPILYDKEKSVFSESVMDDHRDPVLADVTESMLLTKAEKCLEIAEKFDIDPEDDDLKEECATYLMFCPDVYLDKILKIF